MNDEQRALIASLEEQERRLVFTRFDNTDAWRLGSAMVAAATERNLPVTIDIRLGGQQLFHAALPGTTAENDAWIERKVNVVSRFAAATIALPSRHASALSNRVNTSVLSCASSEAISVSSSFMTEMISSTAQQRSAANFRPRSRRPARSASSTRPAARARSTAASHARR